MATPTIIHGQAFLLRVYDITTPIEMASHIRHAHVQWWLQPQQVLGTASSNTNVYLKVSKCQLGDLKQVIKYPLGDFTILLYYRINTIDTFI